MSPVTHAISLRALRCKLIACVTGLMLERMLLACARCGALLELASLPGDHQDIGAMSPEKAFTQEISNRQKIPPHIRYVRKEGHSTHAAYGDVLGEMDLALRKRPLKVVFFSNLFFPQSQVVRLREQQLPPRATVIEYENEDAVLSQQS